MEFKSFCFIAISTIALASSTLVDKCENGIPKPIHVSIEGCQQPPCHLKYGGELLMTTNFTAPKGESVEELEATAEINFLDDDFNFVLSEPNACKGLTNTHCPLEENEPAVYKHTIPVAFRLLKAPAQYVTGTFKMQYNRSHKELLCFKVMFLID